MKYAITIDFETHGITKRPQYPPEPVGVSILNEKNQCTYYAWGHPTENNTTKEKAIQVLRKYWDDPKYNLIFHNAKFDVEVAQVHLECGPLDFKRVHDTMILLFLDDPHATTLALKPAAERLLDMPPEEQDAVRNWLVKNQVVDGRDRSWGAKIWQAPGKLVGDYAKGDVIRTKKLFDILHPRICARGMKDAYLREMLLIPILIENEQQGLRINLALLENDIALYSVALKRVDEWVRQRLGVPELNIDSDRELGNALAASEVVTEWTLTPTGQRSVSKTNLTPDRMRDSRVAQALGYRSRLTTCLGTFMQPWFEVAKSSGGIIYTNWNQVRQEEGGAGKKGTRTGRFSSNPNFQNVPKKLDERDDGYTHPDFIEVPPLPMMRKYILPDEGHIILHRDYSQQELRILAYFEDKSLYEAYNLDPKLDVHTYIQQEIQRITGLALERRSVKVLVFGILYGMGLAKLAIGLKSTVDEARRVKNALRRAVPGLRELEKSLQMREKLNEPITTWGGRKYYVEPAKMVNGVKMSFGYKLLNYLIQGSGADITKQAILNYIADPERKGRFLVTVHDEINVSVEAKHAAHEMQVLKRAMESVPLDVPLLSEGKCGYSWADLKPMED